MARHAKHAAKPLNWASYARHTMAITVITNLCFVRHLIAVYKAFDGDLIASVVLGEVAHHNLAALTTPARTPLELSEVLIRLGTGDGAALLPTNAFSIAAATGIPRETVRRKVAALVRRGWLARDDSGNLFVTSAPCLHFADFNRARVADMLQAAADVTELMGEPGRASRPEGPHRRPRKRRP